MRGHGEVDEDFVDGAGHGGERLRAAVEHTVMIVLELEHPQGFGRVRLRHVRDACGDGPSFVHEGVAPGSVVLTDGWDECDDLANNLCSHKVVTLSASPNPPKCWIVGIRHGSIDPVHG
ncbi:MAG: transposase [Acidimicrobiales bacterium]